MGSDEPLRPPIDAGPVIQAYVLDVDRTLIAKNLALSVEERFVQLMALQEFAEELRRAGHAAKVR